MPSEQNDLELSLRTAVQQSIAAKQRLLENLGDIEVAVAEALITCYHAGNKLILFGNGGSAADCLHIAAEFVGRFYFNRPPLPALALTANVSSLTAIGNDYGFADVFSRQIVALGNPGDVAMGLTTSGNSENVIAGLRAAKERGLITAALTGASAGRLRSELTVDYLVTVPSDETPRIQECHTLLCHTWSQLVEATLFGSKP